MAGSPAGSPSAPSAATAASRASGSPVGAPSRPTSTAPLVAVSPSSPSAQAGRLGDGDVTVVDESEQCWHRRGVGQSRSELGRAAPHREGAGRRPRRTRPASRSAADQRTSAARAAARTRSSPSWVGVVEPCDVGGVECLPVPEGGELGGAGDGSRAGHGNRPLMAMTRPAKIVAITAAMRKPVAPISTIVRTSAQPRRSGGDARVVAAPRTASTAWQAEGWVNPATPAPRAPTPRAPSRGGEVANLIVRAPESHDRPPHGAALAAGIAGGTAAGTVSVSGSALGGVARRRRQFWRRQRRHAAIAWVLSGPRSAPRRRDRGRFRGAPAVRDHLAGLLHTARPLSGAIDGAPPTRTGGTSNSDHARLHSRPQPLGALHRVARSRSRHREAHRRGRVPQRQREPDVQHAVDAAVAERREVCRADAARLHGASRRAADQGGRGVPRRARVRQASGWGTASSRSTATMSPRCRSSGPSCNSTVPATRSHSPSTMRARLERRRSLPGAWWAKGPEAQVCPRGSSAGTACRGSRPRSSSIINSRST